MKCVLYEIYTKHKIMEIDADNISMAYGKLPPLSCHKGMNLANWFLVPLDHQPVRRMMRKKGKTR